MSVNPPAGWYPDPSGRPGQRYYDGQRWTEHFTPPPPPLPYPYPAQPPPVAVAVSTGGGVNHALHAVLTLFTCGMWLPIWILCAIFGRSGSAVAVAGPGATVPPNRKPLIVGGVILGWTMLGVSMQHPWLLIVLVPMVGAGGFFFWKQKSARDRRDQELREQYRRDVLSNRAEYEDRQYYEGDPHGTYGRYMPPPPFDHDQGAS